VGDNKHPYQVCGLPRDFLVSCSLSPLFVVLSLMLKSDRTKERRGRHLDPCSSTGHVAAQPEGSRKKSLKLKLQDTNSRQAQELA